MWDLPSETEGEGELKNYKEMTHLFTYGGLTQSEQDTALKLLRQFISHSLQEGNPIPDTTTISIHREGQLYGTIKFPTPIDSKGRIRISILTRIILGSLIVSNIVGWLMMIAGIVLWLTDTIVNGRVTFIIFIVGYGLMCLSHIPFDKVEKETELVKSYFEEYDVDL